MTLHVSNPTCAAHCMHRECLDSYISQALDVPLHDQHCLSPVDNSAYILTLDVAVKMLNIHWGRETALMGMDLLPAEELGPVQSPPHGLHQDEV